MEGGIGFMNTAWPPGLLANKYVLIPKVGYIVST